MHSTLAGGHVVASLARPPYRQCQTRTAERVGRARARGEEAASPQLAETSLSLQKSSSAVKLQHRHRHISSHSLNLK